MVENTNEMTESVLLSQTGVPGSHGVAAPRAVELVRRPGIGSALDQSAAMHSSPKTGFATHTPVLGWDSGWQMLSSVCYLTGIVRLVWSCQVISYVQL